MSIKLGSRNGKNSRRLFFLNKKRKLNLQNQEYENNKKKEELEKKDKEQQLIDINKSKIELSETIKIDQQEIKPIIDIVEQEIKKSIKDEKKEIENELNILDSNPIIKVKQDNSIIENQLIVSFQENIIKTDTNIVNDKNIDISSVIDKSETSEIDDDYSKKIIDDSNFRKGKKNVISSIKDDSKTPEMDINYVEKQIIEILEKQIDDDKYELKKIDSEIYSIKKLMESIDNEDEIEEIEKRIEILVERINDIKRKIESLRKTFDINFPVDEPDNYLIYLVEEYQDKGKLEQELSEKLKQNQEFKELIDEIIEIERSNDDLKQQIQVKKEKYLIDDEQVKKITDDMVSIDDIKNKITQMLETQTKLLDEIKQKVNETVHINERISIISKTVNHSLLDLFLLMAIFKHNLSIKNNVLAAISTKIALDMIIKMTTPIEEKIIIKENDLVDYQTLINNCLDDTNNLENIINSNLNDIESIRYIFEHNYKECSYLDSYQEALLKLSDLENEMKNRKKDIINIKYETQFQLEKNEEKVQKYSL